MGREGTYSCESFFVSDTWMFVFILLEVLAHTTRQPSLGDATTPRGARARAY